MKATTATTKTKNKNSINICVFNKTKNLLTQISRKKKAEETDFFFNTQKTCEVILEKERTKRKSKKFFRFFFFIENKELTMGINKISIHTALKVLKMVLLA